MSVSVPVLRSWARKLESAKNKGDVVKQMMRETGWSRNKCYAKLGSVGYASGRKKREDAKSSRANEVALEDIAKMLESGVRKTGTRIMQVTTARSILEANGVRCGVSTESLRRVLKQRHMDAKSLKQEKAYMRLRSGHPNYLHEVDPSLCVMYYSPGDKQCILHEREIHRNKFEKIAKKVGNKKLWRYVLVDHYSASIVCKYYEAAGENQYNMWDFLLYAWGRKEKRGYVQHGVPDYLLWDCGSANTSKAVQRALGMLGVESITHMPGNPRAKGSVENGNKIIETQFESRIYLEPVNNVDELNESVEYFCRGWNNNSLLHYDSSLSRGDKRELQRTGLWLRIRGEQLKELPDEKVCRGLLTHEAVQRKVAGDLSISYKHPRQARRRLYDVRGVPGVYRDAVIEVQPIIMSEDKITVVVEQLDGSIVRSVVKPIEFDEVGFAKHAPLVGQEYKAVAHTVIDDVKKELETLPREVSGARRMLEQERELGVQGVPDGTPIVMSDELGDQEEITSVVEVARRFKRMYPQWWHESAYEMLKGKYPGGMREADIRAEEGHITGLQDAYADAIEQMKKLAVVGAAALLATHKDGRGI